MVFHWSLSNNKPLQVSRTLLSILADINNAVVLILTTRPLISKSSRPFTKSLVTVLRAPTTIVITSTFMFHSFFNSLTRSKYLSFFLLSFNFTLWAGTAKSTIEKVLFLLIILRSGRLIEIRGSDYISKSQRSFFVSFSWTDSGLCIYHLFVWSNLDFLHSFQWITFPTQSCLVLFYFCARPYACSLVFLFSGLFVQVPLWSTSRMVSRILRGGTAQVFILFTNPSARVGYDTRSIFKRSLTGLNSEFSFS